MSDTDSDPAHTRRARRPVGAVATAWLLGAGIPLAAIGYGIWLLAGNFSAAGPEFLIRYVFGERRMEPLTLERDVANAADPGADLASDIHDVISRDWSVIGGYFLILFTCSVIFMVIMLAFSNSARNLSFAIFGAVIVASAMDVAENICRAVVEEPAPVLGFPARQILDHRSGGACDGEMVRTDRCDIRGPCSDIRRLAGDRLLHLSLESPRRR